MASASRDRAMAAVKSIWDRYFLIANNASYNGFDRRLMADAVLMDASVGPPYGAEMPEQLVPPASVAASATFSLLVSEGYSNLRGVMHGGAAGVIFDMLTTVALAPISRPGHWDFLGGVTRVLNISYLKAVPIGTTVHVHSHVYQVGRTMAYIKGWMTSEDGKTVYCICEHHKVNTPSHKAHMETKIDWDKQWEVQDSKL